jgi:Zn-dependent alcohol dehydrogenase
MSEYAVIDEASAIPIPEDVPFEIAAIIGCAVATGVGAVINTAQARAGSSAAVIGCGGIGLSAILGCHLAGCSPVVAVDIADTKLMYARQVGATATLNSKETDIVGGLRSVIGRGPDYVFDSVGSAATIPLALKAVAPGGAAVIMGLHAAKVDVPIPAGALVMQNKRLLGSFVGSIRPQVDLPKLVGLYRAGRLPLEKLITRRYSLECLLDAFADMEAATIARAVITFDH